ncbi:enolase C-terminal domain-like protein [Ramlibacter sp. Leaf400]|uniref:enolase C-terminal domain-like protein n=1 Tax=Ramlibacter sp. Leaf400 TaxID=1736365 RepID=UPI0006F3907D|nr:enolase C-terminal domain-like protein [Ramlibacter sp. Leaf400]KQT13018.1 mandelate racemase [Ramlibacter sp. Leaf400]
MAEAMRVKLREIELYERPVRLRLPFRFGVVTLTECPQAFVRARVETADGRSGWGAAAELMAPKWFDKNLQLSNEDNFDQLRQVLRLARDAYLSDAAPASAFGHFARHHDAHQAASAAQGFNPLLASYGPALLDRAVLDAACRLQGVSFYEAVRGPLAGIGAGRREFEGLDLEAFLSGLSPQGDIEARHTVGLVDAITAQDLSQRVDDGLPETLEEVIATYGHRWFKLKVGGQVAADLERLRAIAAVLDRSPQAYFVSLDGNEQYTSAAGVAELVAAVRATPALARLWSSVRFIEQPIARKLALQEDLRGTDLGKPVIVDESDGELDSFVQARERGYSGVSSKTCKGFYKSLLNAARCTRWNRELGREAFFMSAEDLTTQAGLSVQQDLALVNLLGIRHVERNGHHYVDGLAAVPQAEQQRFLQAHPDLYEHSHGAVRLRLRDGRLALGSLAGPGFASGAMPDFAAMKPLGG